MNKKTALAKSLLKGDVITVSNSIALTGYSNPAREIPREIERPFKLLISRLKRETKDQFGNYAMFYEYRLNKSMTCNQDGMKKMREYIKAQEK